MICLCVAWFSVLFFKFCLMFSELAGSVIWYLSLILESMKGKERERDEPPIKRITRYITSCQDRKEKRGYLSSFVFS